MPEGNKCQHPEDILYTLWACPQQDMDQIAIDLMGALTPSPYGHKYVMTVLNNFSKYPELIPLKDKSV